VARRIVEITKIASDDLNNARKWLHQPGAGTAARHRYRALSRAIRILRTDPMRYRRDPEDEHLRIISVEGYRIIYAVTPVIPDTGDNRTAGDMTVLAVLGPGEP
jgi:plasmid stabilization system protein ParE